MANHQEQCNCDQALELRKLLVEAKGWIEDLEGRLMVSGDGYYNSELGAFRERLDKHWAFKEPKS